MTTEQDINILFEEILLTEERLRQQGYEEGLNTGCVHGHTNGYQLGYSKGLELGVELADIYATVVAKQQLACTAKVRKTLQMLRESIDVFPRENNHDDIIGTVEQIRSLCKHLQVLIRDPKQKASTASANKTPAEECKDYSF